jgi:extracellular elastinolytic metalloproteinase
LDDGTVRLAWSVVVEPAGGEHWWTMTVDAENGDVLQTIDLVVSDDLTATANALARPATGAATTTAAAQAPGPAQTVDDGSSYRVFPLPMESPLDGDRALVTNPASADASPFGWHDTDGAGGPEFTRTRGNNVHAYADRSNDNVPDPGTDPDGGAGLDFDFPLDLTRRPLDSQAAMVTNLFYWNNVIHDVMHGYGFDEAAGNFQVNTYGRGGLGGDDVRAEAQDGSGRNKANFGTLVDGQRPRMQMYEWRSSAPNPIVVAPPSPIAGTYFGPMAGFGESLLTTGPITGEVVEVGRGCDPAYQAGQPLDPYPATLAGQIALIDRGSCTFVAKVKKAQAFGAVMVIVANNAPGPAVAMGGADPTIVIPSVMVTQSDGVLFKANDPFVATISDGTGGAPDRDSDLDAGVIAHEYGHGISNRLTGGPAVVTCLQNDEQMGEGWSDFYGLAFTAKPGDTATQTRGIGNYVSFQPPDGPGIRPRPYTTDLAANEFTYAMIPGGVTSQVLTVPHGIGFVWNSMLWEVYWNLVAKHGFNPNIYDAWNTGGNNLAVQLVTDGMKFQPCRPGFVDGRETPSWPPTAPSHAGPTSARSGGASPSGVWGSAQPRAARTTSKTEPPPSTCRPHAARSSSRRSRPRRRSTR